MGVGQAKIWLVFVAYHPAFGHVDQHEYPPAVPERTGRFIGAFFLIHAYKLIREREDILILGHAIPVGHDAKDFLRVTPHIGKITRYSPSPVISGKYRYLLNRPGKLGRLDSLLDVRTPPITAPIPCQGTCPRPENMKSFSNNPDDIITSKKIVRGNPVKNFPFLNVF
jgi:hypothetical protein